MKSKFKVISLCLLIVFLFSSCGGGGGNGGDPFPELDETALPGLFGIWECTSTITSLVCNGESVDEEIGNETVEEYRIFATEDGCALGNTKEDGEPLNTNWEIFPEETTCRAGGDLLLLELDSETEEGDCTDRMEAVVPLRLSEDQLSGDVSATRTRSQECFEDFEEDSVCEITTSIVCEAVVEAEPEPEPEPDPDPDPEVIPEPEPLKTSGLNLKLKIADYSDVDATACPMIFSLCNGDGDCYQAQFNEEEGAVLERGGYYEFSFNDDTALGGSEPLINFIYPDNYISMDLEMPECSYDGPGVYIEGIEVEAQFLGEEDYVDVFRDPCFYRWVNSNQDWDHSPLGFNDDAWCFNIETGSNSTNDYSVFIDLELSTPMDVPGADDWLSYYQPSSTRMLPAYEGEESISFRLSHVGYDDWTVDAEDTYGLTFGAQGYGEAGRLSGGIRLRHDHPTDGWRVSSLSAVYFKPGDANFLNSSQCQRLSSVDLGNILLDNDTDGAPMALPDDETYYYVGEPEICSELSSILPIVRLPDLFPGGIPWWDLPLIPDDLPPLP